MASEPLGEGAVVDNVSGTKTSEPSGEGDGGCDVIVNVDNDDDSGGGGQYVDLLLFCQNLDFGLDSGLQIRILTPSRVELIDKRSILCLVNRWNR
eukprot:scaffold21693_cov87-Skeletonema_dohrnii-CCMP3373.AAC.1